MNGRPPDRVRAAFTARVVAITLVAVGAALLATLALQPWIAHTQFVLFYVAVMLAAAVGGLRLAVLATLLSLLLVELFVFRDVPVESAAALLLRHALLALVSLAGAYLLDRTQRARHAAQQRLAEAEVLASELQEQAQQLELQVGESETMASELEQVNQQLQVQTEAAARAATRSARLQRLTGLLLETTGEAAVARVIVSDARLAVDAAAAAVALLRDEGRIEAVALAGYPDTAAADTVFSGPSPLADVIHTGEPIWMADPDELQARYPAFAGRVSGHRAWASLPLRAERRQLGALLFSFDQAGDFPPEDRSFMQLLAQQCAQALERARLHETTFRARIRAEFAERKLAFLSEASARLSESLDYHATLANLARLTVPDLADWCLVHLRNDNGVARLVDVVHSSPDRAVMRRRLEERYPGSGLAAVAFEQVMATGAPHHIERITHDLLRSTVRDDELFEALRAFELRSQITVPIWADDTAYGTITLVSAESGRIFGEADVRLAVELGRRAGQAIANARLYQAAHYASEAKSDFLAVMSHELRTPLNAIIGYADLLLLGVPNEVPDKARRQVERIRSASNSLLHLVEEVLSFSRIEAGKEEIRISPVDVSALMRDAVAMIEPLAAEKSLAIELDLPEERLKIVSDERKIRQILTNLLSNAVKFTERGRVRVCADASTAVLAIRVSDTGIGIPPEHLERVFDPFWQVEQSSTRRFGGTGLGLGVARKLAHLLEGSLEVTSDVGVGSTFTLTLPRRTPGTGRAA
jgi:signal transduction histidine kinase